jgi:GNAT superfamily N-acetyltransferase
MTTQLGYPVDAQALRARVAELHASDADGIFVATDADDTAIAWIHVARLFLLEASGLACIYGLVVDERHRSDGIGASLVEAAERWARERGATTVLVRSRSTRERAHRFYERLGYVEVKRSHVFEKPLV